MLVVYGLYELARGLVYGRQSQWVRNVIASDSFTLRTKGRDYQLERPEIIPSSQALAAYPRLWQWTLKRQKIDQFVWAHSAPTRDTAITPDPTTTDPCSVSLGV